MIYSISESFPAEEKFGLVSQLRKSSVSVSSNLAEGSSRNSVKEQKRFYNMAYSSAVELLNQLIICKDLEFLNNDNYKNLRSELEEITLKINRLYQSI